MCKNEKHILLFLQTLQMTKMNVIKIKTKTCSTKSSRIVYYCNQQHKKEL